MNDDLTPELLASGYVDGTLSAEDRARVEADPSLLARVATHAAARDAVAAPVEPLPEATREAFVTQALAAADAARATGPAEVSDGRAPVVELAAARARRRRRAFEVAAGLAAAAVVAAIALAITRPGNDAGGGSAGGTKTEAGSVAAAEAPTTTGVAAGLDQSGAGSTSTLAAPGTTAAGAPVPAASAAPGTFAAAEGGTSGSGRDASTLPPSLPDLGLLQNRTEFIAAARRFATASAPSSAAPAACAGYPPPLATATFQGIPAFLVITAVAADGDQLALVAQGSCTVLVKVDLAEQ